MKKAETPVDRHFSRLLWAALLCLCLVGVQSRVTAQEPDGDTAEAVADAVAATDEGSVAGVDMHPSELNKDEQIRRQERALLGELALEEGNNMLVKGDYEKAVESFGAAKGYLLDAGNTADIQRKIAKIDALTTKAYRAWANDLANQAELDLNAEKFDTAIAKTQKMAELNPDMAAFAEERIKRYQAIKQNVSLRKQVTTEVIDPLGEQREDDVGVLLEQGKRLYKKRLYVDAKQKYSAALVLDPFNIEAIDGLIDVNRQLRAHGEQRRKVTEMERIAESTWKWNESIVTLATDTPLTGGTTTVPKPSEEASLINEKLKSIVLPHIDFEEATIHQVIRYLRDKSRELDPDGKGVSIVYQSGEGEQETTEAPAKPAADDGAFDFDDGGAGWDNGGGAAPATPVAAPAGGTVTIAATDIPLGDAIRFVCESANLDFLVTEYAVLIGTGIDRKMEVKIFDVPQGMFGIDVTKKGGDLVEWDVQEVEGTDAAELGDTDMRGYLTQLGIEFPPKSAAKLIRNKTRLWVRNTPENIRLVEEYLEANTIDPGQVTIEAKFVEITQNDLEALGFEWLINNGAKYGESGMGGYTEYGSWGGSAIIGGAVTETAKEWATVVTEIGGTEYLELVDKLDEDGFPITRATGLATALTGALRFAGTSYGVNDAVLGVNSILGSMEFDTVIHALDRADSTDVLSCPKVTAKSDQTAILRVVTERYFPESWTEPELEAGGTDANGTYKPSVAEFGEARDIGVILEATPKVDPKNDYLIDLLLRPQVYDFIGYDESLNYEMIVNGERVEGRQSMPIISARTVETNVMVWDGETVVLGGMITENLVQNDDKVPILGDVPLLGRFFQSHSKKSEKRNLLIFVTARMVDPAGRPKRANHDVRGLVDFGR
ncbi:MAG: hypothetical protein RRC34_09790 [Lentisphaeria bacterium]|nr:hypothetical protein [Lentisphaeria bacterium]